MSRVNFASGYRGYSETFSRIKQLDNSVCLIESTINEHEKNNAGYILRKNQEGQKSNIIVKIALGVTLYCPFVLILGQGGDRPEHYLNKLHFKYLVMKIQIYIFRYKKLWVR